uniref:Uncharacterized protein n=1 Tax=Arundo donax TaxID=35708 RepID=A0A0A9BCE2_ARUDO
MLCSSFLSHL